MNKIKYLRFSRTRIQDAGSKTMLPPYDTESRKSIPIKSLCSIPLGGGMSWIGKNGPQNSGCMIS